MQQELEEAREAQATVTPVASGSDNPAPTLHSKESIEAAEETHARTLDRLKQAQSGLANSLAASPEPPVQ